MKPESPVKRILRIMLIFLIIMFVFNIFGAMNVTEPEELGLNDIKKIITENTIESVVIFPEEDRLEIYKKGADEQTPPIEEFYPAEYEDELTELLIENDINPTTEIVQPNVFISILASLLPFILILGIFWFLLYRRGGMGGGGLSGFTKSKAKLVDKSDPKVTFEDVAGIDEAVKEVEEIRDYLTNHSKYMAMGAKIPKGVLFMGPPGTGKTLLARAVAGESDVAFFSVAGSDFIEMFVGTGASRIRDLFEKAKENAPAIVFIDEIDALGSRGGPGDVGGNREHHQTLNALLTQMDGFDGDTNVMVIGATNRSDMIDQALLRAGRFDRKIVVGMPDSAGREAILNVHARGKPVGDDVDFRVIARQTHQFSGADLASLVNEAAILAVRQDKQEISQADFQEAIDRVRIGLKKNRPVSEKDREITAFHEVGHTLVGYVLRYSDPVHKVTIVGRGMSGGHTESLPEEERIYASVYNLKDRVASLLGGRAAEKALLGGDYTSGASNDISVATDILHQMITQFGMDEELGPRRYGQNQQGNFLGQTFSQHNRDYSEEVLRKIDERKNELLKQAENLATRIISRYEEGLRRMAEELLEKETLKRADIESIFGETGVPRGEITWTVKDGNLKIDFPE
ncbi:MAG: ATP-dependent zinc metalloprotease FtsH [Candidatus Spechtbacterales bacterium]|nr:ATP-dependent zinc metalloprotease FtsH [Candidatus Spechtbacterales bacterium]